MYTWDIPCQITNRNTVSSIFQNFKLRKFEGHQRLDLHDQLYLFSTTGHLNK